MSLLHKYKKEILASLAILAFYLASRLILLGDFPIFTDEALYVRWTQIAAQDANWRFISLTDGKQPMLIWFGVIFLKFISDPLTAVRLVSVFSGIFTLVGLWFLTQELFKDRRAAFLSCLLYVFYPFALVYDRLALYDSMVGTFAIWAIYFSILLVRKIRLDIAYTLGFVIGGGMLTKTSANFSIILIPLTLILFNFKQKNWIKSLAKWIILALIAVAIAEAAYNLLRLSPFFHIIKEKNTIFVYYPFSIPISENIRIFLENTRGLSNWLLTYLSPVYTLLILFSFASRQFIKEKLLLILYFLLPFLALAFFGKVVFPRFIFFMSLYLLPLASLGLIGMIDMVNKFMKDRKLNASYAIIGLIIVFSLIYPAKVSLDFIFNPAGANIADPDKRQYVTEWPSGGGIKESVVFFKEQAKDKKIFIGTEGSFGLLPYALEIYLADNPNVKLKGYWPINEEIPQEVLNYAETMPAYFIFYQPCIPCEFTGFAPKSWPLKLISQFKKSDGAYYSIYEVIK